MFRQSVEKKNRNSTFSWRNYAPLLISVNISCPLYNLKPLYISLTN